MGNHSGMKRLLIRFSWVVLGGVLSVRPAAGFIDPHFTPIDLLRSAQSVIAAHPKLEDDGTWRLVVGDRLKGDAPDAIPLSLEALAEDDRATVASALSRGHELGAQGAIAYLGEFQGVQTVHLHAGNRWMEADLGADDVWAVSGLNPRMVGTYDGSTVALLRITRYLLAHPDGTVPVTVGMIWLDRTQVGQANGAVRGMLLVQPFGESAQAHVHVFGEEGDTIWRVNGDDTFTDVTAETGLDTASQHADWFRRPGASAASLISHADGVIRILDVVEGQFRQSSTLAVGDGCLGLQALTVGGEQAILVAFPDVPMLAREQQDGQWVTTPLPVDPALLAAAGSGATALAADFNQDGAVSILQPRANHGLMWRGSSLDALAAEAVAIRHAGSATPVLALGDWNTDGRLAVFVSGPFESELWEQRHDGTFHAVAAIGGSLSYKAHPGAAWAIATDLNHDGRPDLGIFYADRVAVYHFNRGYGAMGEEGELPLDAGLVAAVAADMNADSSLDLLAARRDGTLVYMSNDLFDVPSIELSLGADVPEPVTVSVWQGEGESAFCVGTVPVRAKRPSVVALRTSGEVLVRWRLAGQDEAEKRLTVGHGQKAFTIERP